MSRFVHVVFTAPKEGQENEYNEWYDGRHLSDTVRIPGFVSGERFVLSDTDPPQAGLPKYMALYEIEADDIDGVLGALAEARAAGQMPSSDTLDRSVTLAAFYEPTGAPTPTKRL